MQGDPKPAEPGMRHAATRLADLLARGRWWVAGAWFAIVLVSMPFAARQTEHLSGGGFEVPGSQSKAVEDALERDSAMQLMGRWNWWLPGWLDRVLPDLGFESESPVRGQARATAEL